MQTLIAWAVALGIAFLIINFLPFNNSRREKMIIWACGALVSGLGLIASTTYSLYIAIFLVLLVSVLITFFLQSRLTVSTEHEEEAFHDVPYGEEGIEEQPRYERVGTETLAQKEATDFDEEKEFNVQEESEDPAKVAENDIPFEHFEEDNDEILGEEDFFLEPASHSFDGPFESEEENSELERETFVDSPGEEELLLEEELIAKRKHVDDIEDIETEESTSVDENEQELLNLRNASLFEDEQSELDLVEAEDSSVDEVKHEPGTQNQDFDVLPVLDEVEQDSVDGEGDDGYEEDINEQEVKGRDKIQEEANPDLEKFENDASLLENIESLGDEEVLLEDESLPEEDNEIQGEEPVIQEILHSEESDHVLLGEDSLESEEAEHGEGEQDEALRKQLLDLMITRLDVLKPQMAVEEYEAYVKGHLTDSLSDLEYYLIAKRLLSSYIDSRKYGLLAVFIQELKAKMSEYPILLMELQQIENKILIND